jgi:hypothetical protein
LAAEAEGGEAAEEDDDDNAEEDDDDAVHLGPPFCCRWIGIEEKTYRLLLYLVKQAVGA